MMFVALTGCQNNASDEVLSYLKDNSSIIDLSSETALNSFLHDKDCDIYLVGETHAVDKSYQIKKEMISYLNKNKGVRNILIEDGIGSSVVINEYVQTGDESLLKFFTSHYEGTTAHNQCEYDFWKWLAEYNSKLNDDEKLHIAGLDLDHVEALAVKGKEIRPEWKEVIDKSIVSSKEFYKAEESDEALPNDFRDEVMQDHFEYILKKYPDQIFFGQLGSEHTLLKKCDTNYGTKDDNRFGMRLLTEETTKELEVCSILCEYPGYEDLNTSDIFGINIISDFANSDFLIDLSKPSKVFDGYKYFQAIIVLNNVSECERLKN